MKIVIAMLSYLYVGYFLDFKLSKEPNLWGVILWPVLAIGVFIKYILYEAGIYRSEKR